MINFWSFRYAKTLLFIINANNGSSKTLIFSVDARHFENALHLTIFQKTNLSMDIICMDIHTFDIVDIQCNEKGLIFDDVSTRVFYSDRFFYYLFL